MIAELQAERDRLTQAIEALERLNTGTPTRRGRPAGWLKKELNGTESGHDQPDSE